MTDFASAVSRLSEIFDDAERGHLGASRKLASDKRRRSGSIMEKVVDFLSETDVEEAERIASERLAEVRTSTTASIDRMLHSEARAKLAARPELVHEWKTQHDRTKSAGSDVELVEEVIALATAALASLEKAKDAAASARTKELWDVASDNKGIAFMSSMATASAKTALSEAKEAVERLTDALPGSERIAAVGTDPDDTLDLVFDIVFDMGFFDFTSWQNYGKLGTAVGECEKVMESVNVVLDRCRNALTRLAEKRDAEAAALFDIERLSLVEVALAVPENIAFSIPNHIREAMGLNVGIENQPPSFLRR